jgi:oligoribonuclease
MTAWKVGWLDLETGGLDEDTHPILEVYMRATRADPKDVVGEFHAIINVDPAAVAQMDPYAQEKHKNTNLLHECFNSGRNVASVGDDLMTFLMNFGAPREIMLAGSSIHFDRKFIAATWPQIDKYLHYRMLDVSSGLLFRNAAFGYDPEHSFPAKTNRAHRAKEDVEMSIALAMEHVVSFLKRQDSVTAFAEAIDLLVAHDAMFKQLHPDLDPRDSLVTKSARARLEGVEAILADGRRIAIRGGHVIQVSA